MEIILAESLGFCMGVKRAVDMAYRAREKSAGAPVVTLGPPLAVEYDKFFGSVVRDACAADG